jgi:ADP-heptose:LPS heptosyltransferase
MVESGGSPDGNRRRRARRVTGRVERIAVFRALMLGDLLCAVPALRALRAGFPQAQITLVGLPWARALVQRLGRYVDGFIDFPGWPGLPETRCDVRALPDFLAQVQARRFDLALQMHGSGAIANPLVACFGARHSAGFHAREASRPKDDGALFVEWPEQGHEIDRLLALTDALGAPRRGRQLEFPLQGDDRRALREVWPAIDDGGPYVCVHAGAQLASRRWPLERFAQVADAIAQAGRRVVLTGGVPESALADALAACMRHEPVNLVGRTSLWMLGALIEGAERVVCNDTGVSHIAAALGRPSVVVSCGADVARWAPLDREQHQVLWQPMACRPCAYAECPFEHGCATAIGVPQVLHSLGLPQAQRVALSS